MNRLILPTCEPPWGTRSQPPPHWLPHAGDPGAPGFLVWPWGAGGRLACRRSKRGSKEILPPYDSVVSVVPDHLLGRTCSCCHHQKQEQKAPSPAPPVSPPHDLSGFHHTTDARPSVRVAATCSSTLVWGLDLDEGSHFRNERFTQYFPEPIFITDDYQCFFFQNNH